MSDPWANGELERERKRQADESFGSRAEPSVVATAATSLSFTEYEWDEIVSSIYARCHEFCASDNCDCSALAEKVQTVRAQASASRDATTATTEAVADSKKDPHD